MSITTYTVASNLTSIGLGQGYLYDTQAISDQNDVSKWFGHMSTTLMLPAAHSRQRGRGTSSWKDGIWSQARGQELTNKTIGILGFGNIGNHLADFLKPYKCKILGFDIQQIERKEVIQSTAEEIFADADIVSIHLPLTDSSKGFIDKKLFEISKKDLKIINTSRGGIVNEEHLFDFLKNNEKAFAAFDVFEVEPAFDSPLLNLKNFFATSHLGSMTEEGVIAMGLAAIEGLDENNK